MVGARFEYTHIPFSMFRLHDAQKTGDGWKQTQSLLSAATQLDERAAYREHVEVRA